MSESSRGSSLSRPAGRAIAALLLFLAAFAAASACSSGPDRLTADELVERADAACNATNDEIDDLLTVSGADATSAAEHLEQVTAAQRRLHGELAALHPPSDLQDTYDEWIDAVGASLEANERLVQALRANDAAERSEAVAAADEAAGRANAAAAELGLTRCTAADAG